jgi:cytochrome b561
MAAQAELSLLPARKPYRRVRIYAPEACAALFVVVTGTAGLIAHSWPRQLVESWINIHLLFGLLLCGWVMIRYQRRVSQSPAMLPADVRGLSRQLSRIVYCVLYGVVGLKQSISIVSSLWHGGAVDFSLFDESFRQGPDTQDFDLHDDFQLFLASGLVPLVIVRVMAFRLWMRLIDKSLS